VVNSNYEVTPDVQARALEILALQNAIKTAAWVLLMELQVVMLKFIVRWVVRVLSNHYLDSFVGELQVTILAGSPSAIDLELRQR